MTLKVISFQGYCDNIHGYQDLKPFRISYMALCCAIVHLIFLNSSYLYFFHGNRGIINRVLNDNL